MRTARNKIVNAYNYDHEKIINERPQGISMTIPNQTLSLKELISRFSRGQEVPQLQPIYSNPENDPFFEKMDAVEKIQYAQKLKTQISIAQQTNARLQEEAEKQKMTEEIKKSLADDGGELERSGKLPS